MKILKTRKKTIPSKKKTILKKKWFWNLIIFFIFLLAFYWLLFKTSIFEIKKIAISSPKNMKGEIEKIAGREKNFFLFNKEKTSREIKEKLPQVESVFIKKQFPSTIFLKIKEGEAVGFFCVQQKTNSCFLISEEGFLIKKQNPKRGSLVFVDHTLNKINSGEVIIEKELFKEILKFSEELKRLKTPILKIDIFSFEVIMKTSKNFKIYFLKKNLKEQTEVFFNIFNNTLSQKEKMGLEYIDFRSLENGKKGAVYWK